MSNLSLQERQERQRLINIYLNQYNQTNSQIDRLFNTLDDIRLNLNTLVGNTNTNTNTNRSNRQNRNYNRRGFSNTNTNHMNPINTATPISPIGLINRNANNRQFLNNRGPHIRYDYSNPIDRSTYVSDITNYNRDITSLLTNFLNSTVPIRPTQQQINTASRLVRHSDIQNPVSNLCVISFEHFTSSDMVRQIHHCGHMFFPQHFDEWFRNNVRCPVCRYDIRDYVATTSASETTSTTSASTSINSIPSLLDSEFNNFNINQPTQPTHNNDSADALLTSITNRFLTSLLTSPISSSNNDRFAYDPSNNVLLFETIIRSNPDTNNNNI